METDHAVRFDDARSMDDVADSSVELVVTSPPYPMIELWDEAFSALDPAVGEALDAGDGDRAFSAMHGLLDSVWDEVERVLAPGGVACVNVGDATRTVGEFQVYPNHVRITRALRERGLTPLPDILWRKPANSGAKFMGSGMLPTNAYATLEHEYVLVFRKGGRREFEPGSDRRYESAYFWEERNRWFSDLWDDVRGIGQGLADPDLRERSAAFPFAIPYRLLCMYSVYGDTVLDPFWGTGTTSLAAMVAGRSSIGYELDEGFASVFDDRVESVEELSEHVVERRLDDHRAFVERVEGEGGDLGYEAERYDVPVQTAQERRIGFYTVEDVDRMDGGYRLTHRRV
ncbi:DNA-methyltransferase [Natronorarus salvus]|uniref:DNA-methyltransferase n=1 Tax=Natronorarus salvus TaxID=3117733 RepID=UPI002F26C252